MRFRVKDATWLLKWAKRAEKYFGLTDREQCTIHLNEAQTERQLLGTVIHESIHACDDSNVISEECVKAIEKVATNLLWRLGYRRVK